MHEPIQNQQLLASLPVKGGEVEIVSTHYFEEVRTKIQAAQHQHGTILSSNNNNQFTKRLSTLHPLPDKLLCMSMQHSRDHNGNNGK